MATVYSQSLGTGTNPNRPDPKGQTWCALAIIGAEVIEAQPFRRALRPEVLQIAVKGAYQGPGIASALFAQLPADKEIFLEVRRVKPTSASILQKKKMAVIAEKKGLLP